jgi:hypothetical protein
MVRIKDRGKIKIGRGISTARQMSRGLRRNICDATKRPRYQVARKKLNFTRQEEKGRRKAPSRKMLRDNKKKTHGENYSAVQNKRTEIEFKDGPYRA